MKNEEFIIELLDSLLVKENKNLEYLKVCDKTINLLYTQPTIRREKKKRKSLNRRERREMFSNGESIKYVDMIALNLLWIKYFTTTSHDFQSLIKADYHGCIIKVSKSKIVHLIGVEGIIVEESECSFVIVTRQDAVIRLLKEPSEFCFTVSSNLYTIYGRHMVMKPWERISKKIKYSQFKEL